MELKNDNFEYYHINKLPVMSLSQNHRNNYQYNRNISKKITEKNNVGKQSDSFNIKTNYKFNICPLGSSTIEINKNTSENNNSYQIQNLTNEKNNFEKDKLIVNKANILLNNKIDKNKSFITKNERRDISFNKKENTPNILKHISLKSKNKSIGNNNDNLYFKHLESNSAYSLLNSNKRNNNNFGIKPNYLQYDFEQIKLINKKNFMNIINNKNIKSKENDKNNIFIKENNNINNIKLQKIKNKELNNNNANNIHIKLNNKKHNNIHINLHKIESNNKSEYFSEKNNKEIILTKEEKLIYGNRTMKNYSKLKLLGKGGCGIVWLCYKNNTTETKNKEYAVKQISKKSLNQSLHSLNLEENIKTARNEIKILKYLNELNKENCDIIPKLYEYYEDNNDIWFSYEKGGSSLSSLSFQIKGEFDRGERIYNIQKGIFIKYLFSNISQFKFFIKQILEGIDFINSQDIIHSDIKPENILIEYSYINNIFEIKKIKIIDYGSAFNYLTTSNINSNTPEYLCPEITNSPKNFLMNLPGSKNYINCIDIWSLGITLLELCLSCPIWMSYKSKIILNEKSYYTIGYFGCKGREGNKIYQKQIELSKNLNKILKNSLLYLFNKNDRDLFVDLLGRMLEFNYKKRINIKNALNHPFFKE